MIVHLFLACEATVLCLLVPSDVDSDLLVQQVNALVPLNCPTHVSVDSRRLWRSPAPSRHVKDSTR